MAPAVSSATANAAITQNVTINNNYVTVISNTLVQNNVQASATAVTVVAQQPGNTVTLAQAFANGATGGGATATATAYASASVYLAQSGTATQTTAVASATALGLFTLVAGGQQELAVSTATAYSNAVAAAFGCGEYVAQLINAYLSIILTLLNAQSSGGTVIIIG